FQAEDGIRDFHVTGVQTCALPILLRTVLPPSVPGEWDVLETDDASRGTEMFRSLLDEMQGKLAQRASSVKNQRNEEHVHGRQRRSEERRVGTEGRWSGSRYHDHDK